MNRARGAVVTAAVVVLAAAFSVACATPEKPFKARVVPVVDETSTDTLGDWNTRDPIERMLRPATSELT